MQKIQDWRQLPKRKGFGIETGSDTLTQQHHAKNQDLNEIVRRFGIKGQPIPPAAIDPSYYGDFTDATDFREALDRVRAAQEHFEGLPANIRERFAHDPVRLHRFIMDPENTEEAVRLGLLQKRRPASKPEPVEVRVITEPPIPGNVPTVSDKGTPKGVKKSDA